MDISKTYILNGMLVWTMYLWLVVLTVLCGIHYSKSSKHTYCQAGYYLTKDPASKKEICLVCESGTYMPSRHHQELNCRWCDEPPPPGSWREVIRPCTSKSNTKIRCQRNAFIVKQRSGKSVCKPCTICTNRQKETRPCSEYANRVCSEITPAGEHEKDRSEKSSSMSSSSFVATLTKASEAATEATTTSTDTNPREKGRSSTDAIPGQDAATKYQHDLTALSTALWFIGFSILVRSLHELFRDLKQYLPRLLCRQEYILQGSDNLTIPPLDGHEQ